MNDNYEQQLHQSRQLWNAEAAVFDEQPDHGLRDPLVLAAWTKLLKEILPSNKGKVLDIGCGTGSLSLVIAGFGYEVTGIDFSPEMIALAESKAKLAHHTIKFQIMDAAFPQFPRHQFDVIVCRHLLWTLPEPKNVLQRWLQLLKPAGRLILIEGFWHTGAGLHAQAILDALPSALTATQTLNLSGHADLWGGVVNDERYMIVADVQS